MTFYGFAELSDNWVAKSMLNSLLRLPSVDIKVTQISIGAVCPTPHFDPTLDGLHRHVLFEGVAAFIFYHSIRLLIKSLPFATSSSESSISSIWTVRRFMSSSSCSGRMTEFTGKISSPSPKSSSSSHSTSQFTPVSGMSKSPSKWASTSFTVKRTRFLDVFTRPFNFPWKFLCKSDSRKNAVKTRPI